MKHLQLIARSIFALGFVNISSVSLAAKPVNVSIVTEDSEVEFSGKAKLVPFTFSGSGKGIVGKFKITDGKTMEGSAVYPLDKLDAGLETRTTHMKHALFTLKGAKDETLQDKFKEAKFTPTLLPWADPSEMLKTPLKESPFEGRMVLHGKESDVKGTVKTSLEKDSKVKFVFKFVTPLSAFEIAPPTYMKIVVDDPITVVVTALGKVEVL